LALAQAAVSLTNPPADPPSPQRLDEIFSKPKGDYQTANNLPPPTHYKTEVREKTTGLSRKLEI